MVLDNILDAFFSITVPYHNKKTYSKQRETLNISYPLVFSAKDTLW
jgi:hypothetical protein